MNQPQIKTLHIEFTTACNSRCVMCDYWKTGNHETIDTELVFSIIADQSFRGLKTVYFTGGECLLFPQRLFPLSHKVKSSFPELRLGIITNGLLLEKYYREVAALFHKVIVSFDAISPAVYNKIRGVDGVEKIKRGICLLKEFSSQTQVNLRVLVRNDNLDELLQIIEYASNQNVDRISFIPEDTSSENCFGRMEKMPHTSSQNMSPTAFRKIIEQIKTRYYSQMGKLLRANLDDLDYIYYTYFEDQRCFPRCNKASVSCVINSDGLVSPCFFIRGTQKVSANVTLQSIIESEEYLNVIQRINRKCYLICSKCPCPKELS